MTDISDEETTRVLWADSGHSWTMLGTQPYIPWVAIGKPIPHTRVLLRCSECGEPDVRTLAGEWTLQDLQDLQATEATS